MTIVSCLVSLMRKWMCTTIRFLYDESYAIVATNRKLHVS